MKNLPILSLSLFVVSVIFRFFHWPMGVLIAFASVLLMFVSAIYNSVKKEKTKLGIAGGWALFIWLLFILFRYLYWYSGPYILGFSLLFLLASIAGIVYVVLLVNKKEKLSFLVVVVMTFGFVLNFVPSHYICYLFDLNEVINKERNETNFHSWDKYSWFLYTANEKGAALDANKKSINAFNKKIEIYNFNTEDSTMIANILHRHRQEIIDGTWDDAFVRYH